jgi:hypothetical protein
MSRVDDDNEAKMLYEAKMEKYRLALTRERSQDFPYIPNHSQIAELDHFCDLHAALVQPLESHIIKILSPPGFGKSAFLHNWVQQRQLTIKLGQAGAGSFLFTHFVNSSQDEKLSDMLGSLEYELKSHFHLREMALRKTPNQRRWDLPRFLDAANRKSRGVVLIVIDGLSRLKMENGDEADPMLWLPRDLPSKVRVVVSLTQFAVPPMEASTETLNSWVPKYTRSFVELERRGCQCLRLGHMPAPSMQSILGSYARYHSHSFHLSQEQIRVIMENKGSSHPLYLQILLNSLRTMANLACLPDIVVTQILGRVAEVVSVEELLSIVLDHCEETVEMHPDGSDKGALPHILSLLYVSHKGLSEDELFDALGTIDGLNVGAQHRESVRLILKDICMIVKVQGIIHMENESVRRVVWKKYIATDEVRRKHHHILSHFFYHKECCIRKIEELPWHYERMEEFSNLRDLVTDIDVFKLWWGSIPHRPDLLHVWGVLVLPPCSMDLTHEYNAMFEKQCTARHIDDESRTALFISLSMFMYQFSRDGYEDASDCPPLQHSELGWEELQSHGVLVKDNKHDGDHIMDSRPVKSPRKKKKKKKAMISSSGSKGLSTGSEEDDEASRHPCYNYYRWLWVQFPWLLLGLYKQWSVEHKKKVAEIAAGLSHQGEGGEQRKMMARKDPIVLRLEKLAEERLHKEEEAQNIEEKEEDETTMEAARMLKNKEMGGSPTGVSLGRSRKAKKGGKSAKGSPYRISSPGKKSRLMRKPPSPAKRRPSVRKKRAPPAPARKKNKWVIKFTPPANPADSDDDDDAEEQDELDLQSPTHKLHVNGLNILDLDKSDKFSSKLSGMAGDTVAARNHLNRIVLQRKAKAKLLKSIFNELAVLNGLEEGEQMSVGAAYGILNRINEIKAKTEDTEDQSKHYEFAIDMCKKYPANNADWLEQIDTLVEKMTKQERDLKKNTRKAEDDLRNLNAILPQARREIERENRLQEAFLSRLDKQHKIEGKDREREAYFAMRQTSLLAADIVKKRQSGQVTIKKKVFVKGAVTRIRKGQLKSKVKLWEGRIQRLREASGGMDISDILSMLSNFSQDDVHNNLQSQVEMNTTRIARLQDARDRLLVRLKVEMRTKAQSTGGVVLANKDEELTRVKTKVDASIERFMHFQRMLTQIRAGLDHLVTILNIDASVADNPLRVLQKIDESLTEKIIFLNPIVPDLVQLISKEEANDIKMHALAETSNMIGKELGELQYDLWQTKSSTTAPQLKEQEWISDKIHVDLKRLAATKARRPYTPDVLADRNKIPVVSVQRRQFTMDQEKLSHMLEHGVLQIKDTILDRRSMKQASEISANKAAVKKATMQKKKEKELEDLWMRNTA